MGQCIYIVQVHVTCTLLCCSTIVYKYNLVYGIEVFVELKFIPTNSGNEND